MMRKLYLLVCFFLLPFLGLTQSTTQIGYGGDIPAATLYSPMARVTNSSGNDFSRSNIVFTSAEMAAANIPAGSTITKLAFHKRNDGATVATSSPVVFQIWMNNSSVQPPLASTPWTAIETSHTKVYDNAAQAIPAAQGWVEFTLATPFTYTGGSLEIATHWDISAVSGSPTTDKFQWEYTDGYSTSAIGNIGTSAPATLAGAAAYLQRPNVQFTYTAPPCTAPPVSGTASASVTAACPGVDFNLFLSGNTTGAGLEIQWQESADNTNWTDIPGAFTSQVTVSQTVDKYYRAKVSCSGQEDITDAVFVSASQPLNGHAYTINSATVTGGTNFQSFEDLAARLNCAGVSGPVTVTVQPGAYTGRFVLNTVPGVSATNTLTIEGNGQTLAYAPAASAERAAVLLNGAQYITINNLTIDVRGGDYGWGIQLMNGAHNNRLTNNTILAEMNGSTNNWGGIVASASLTSLTDGDHANNTTITGNTISGGQWGIHLRSSAALATGNLIANNAIRDFYNYGIYLRNQNGTIVRANDISRPTRTTLSTFYGLYLEGGSQANLFEKNRLHNSHGGNPASSTGAYAIYFSSTDAPGGFENRVVNNLVYDMNSQSGTQYGIYNTNSDGAHYFHNTIVLDNQQSVDGDARGVQQSTKASNLVFENNIFYVTRSGYGDKHGLYFSSDETTFTSYFNVIYVNPASGPHFTGRFGSQNFATLTDWQGQGYDANSVSQDPVFTDPAAANFTPTNSIADGSLMGTFVPHAVDDILGVARGVSPDPGVFEWTPATNDLAITRFVKPTAMPYCDNTLPVTFRLINTGTALLTSATINWTMNGVAQSPVNLTGLNLLPGEASDVVLANPAIQFNQRYDFSASVGSVNGVADEMAVNNAAAFTGWEKSLSGTYTVDQSQPASGVNFVSLQAAADALLTRGICGPVTVQVSPGSGPYTEQFTIHTIPGANHIDTVLFDGGGETVTFAPTSSDRHLVKLRGARYVTVSNFVLTASGDYGWGVQISRGATRVAVKNNTINIPLAIAGSAGFGVSISDSVASGAWNYIYSGVLADTIEISGNTINGGYYGINAAGLISGARTSNDNVRNLSVTGNTIRDSYENGIYAQGVKGSLFQKNDISRPNRSTTATSSSFPFTGIAVVGPHYDYRIDKNRIHDVHNPNMGTTAYTAIGIRVTGNDTLGATSGYSNGVVSNNLVYHFTNPGDQIGIRANYKQEALASIYHNTVVLSDAAYTGSALTAAFQNQETVAAVTPVELKNNVFSIGRGGTGIKRLIDLAAGNVNSLSADYNVFYFSNLDGNVQLGRTGSATYPGLRDWQSTAQDPGSVEADPQFADPATGNFRPMNGAVDGSVLGTIPVGIPDDILDVVRSANPDPGVYESAIPAPVQLSVFSGQRKGSNNELRWSTASESNNKGFWVERSVNGRDYETLGFVSSLAADGNSSGPLHYDFTDANVSGHQHYYRLRQEDHDGRTRYSPVVLLRGDATGNSLKLAGLYPNPVRQGSVTVSLYAPGATAVTLQIADATGRVVYRQQGQAGTGSNTLRLPVSGLAKGTYFVVIEGEGGTALPFIKE